MAGRGKNVKIVTVGDGAVGKTSMLVAYATGKFDENYVPTVFENYATTVTVDDARHNLTLWDTAGQEAYDRCRRLSYPGASVFLVCFSIHNKLSFENVTNVWLPEIRTECGDNIPIVLVGTMIDLRDSLSANHVMKKSKGEKLAKSQNMAAYVECSAKTMKGCREVMNMAVRASTGNVQVAAKAGCVIL